MVRKEEITIIFFSLFALTCLFLEEEEDKGALSMSAPTRALVVQQSGDRLRFTVAAAAAAAAGLLVIAVVVGVGARDREDAAHPWGGFSELLAQPVRCQQ